MLQISNIERLPQGIRPVVDCVVKEIIGLANDNLRAVIVYGSAAGDGFREGKSDINIALVYAQIDFALLTQMKSLMKVFGKKSIATPLLLTPQYLLQSKDVFALEFTAIKQQHVLIAGEDFFSSLTVEDKHIRFCCEQQLRGKILRLRQMYLECKQDHQLSCVLKDSLNALVPVLRELMRLKGFKPADQRAALLEQVARHFGLDEKVFLAIDMLELSGLFKAKRNSKELLEQYLSVLEHLTEVIDRA